MRVCLPPVGGIWIGRRLLKNNMMDDRFNDENESFQQETRLMENEYSINLPTRFYYKKKVEQGLDKRGESVPRLDSAWHPRLR